LCELNRIVLFVCRVVSQILGHFEDARGGGGVEVSRQVEVSRWPPCSNA